MHEALRAALVELSRGRPIANSFVAAVHSDLCLLGFDEGLGLRTEDEAEGDAQ